MKAEFASHSPIAAQLGQLTGSLSGGPESASSSCRAATAAQRASQARGHCRSISALLFSHSPSATHEAQVSVSDAE